MSFSPKSEQMVQARTTTIFQLQAMQINLVHKPGTVVTMFTNEGDQGILASFVAALGYYAYYRTVHDNSILQLQFTREWQVGYVVKHESQTARNTQMVFILNASVFIVVGDHKRAPIQISG